MKNLHTFNDNNKESTSAILYIVWAFECTRNIILNFLYKINNFFIDEKYNDSEGILISDKPIVDINDDKLWMYDKAKTFTETVWNDGATESFVIWLIAPWWHGKSTFLNFFEKILSWKDYKRIDYKNDESLTEKENIKLEVKHNKERLKFEADHKKECKYKNWYEIYHFNPWYFDSEKNLLETFLHGISDTLSDKYYLPRLDSDINSLIQFLSNQWNNFLNTKFSFWRNPNLLSLKKEINKSLKIIDKKFIIIIDDLDRISSDKLKMIFKILDLCQDLHNTTYIVCYDPENFNNIDVELKETITGDSISKEKVDNANLTKYIAKIVSIEYSMFPNYDELKKTFINLFNDNEYLNLSESSKDWVKKSVEWLFLISNFKIWWKYIWNVRWIKRALNLVIAVSKKSQSRFLFNINKWIYFSDFIKLVTVSMYHRDIFRDIYDDVYLKTSLNDSRIIWNHWKIFDKYPSSDERKWNGEFERYLRNMPVNKKTLLRTLFNWYKSDFWWIPNLRLILEIIQWNKEDFSKSVEYSEFLDTKSDIYWEGIYSDSDSLQLFFEELIEEWLVLDKRSSTALELIKDILNRIYYRPFQIEKGHLEKRFALIDYVLNNFWKYNESFTYEIGHLLNLSRELHFKAENVDVDKKKVLEKLQEFFFKEDVWVVKRLIWKEWWIMWLYTAIKIAINVTDSDKYNSYFNLTNAIELKGQDIKGEIYTEFQDKYIKEKKSIFEGRELEEYWRYVAYGLTVTLWQRDDLQEYFFSVCFNWDAWIRDFLRFIILVRFLKTPSVRDIYEKEEIFLDNDYLYKTFNPEDLNKYIKWNDQQIKEVIDTYWNEKVQIKTKYEDGIFIERSYSEFWKIFKEKISEYEKKNTS